MSTFLRPLRILAVSTTAAVLAVVVGAAPAHADNIQPPPDLYHYYALQLHDDPWNYVNPKCVEVFASQTDDGAMVNQYGCHYGTNQQWFIAPVTDDGHIVYLKNVHSGKCMDVAGGSTALDASIIQYDCHLGANQQWYFDWYGLGADTYLHLVNVNSGLCLSVAGYYTNDFQPLTQNQCYDWATDERFAPVLIDTWIYHY